MYTNSQTTAQKVKFSIKDFFSKYDQIWSFLRIWSHLLETFFAQWNAFYVTSYNKR